MSCPCKCSDIMMLVRQKEKKKSVPPILFMFCRSKQTDEQTEIVMFQKMHLIMYILAPALCQQSGFV